MISLSDQILAAADDAACLPLSADDEAHLLLAAKLRRIAAEILPMETALNELVDEEREEANTSVSIHFPPNSRMRP